MNTTRPIRQVVRLKGGATMRPTMSDVAKAASVSTSTVSRALAGDPRVKEETRRHIAEVAAKLGYTPNRTAAALRRGKTWMIGVVTPGTPRAFSDPFYLEFLGGLGDRAMEAGYNLIIAAPSRRPPHAAAPSRRLPHDPASSRHSSPDLSARPPRRQQHRLEPMSPSPHGLDLEGLIAQGAVDAVALTEPALDDPRLPVLRRYRVPFAFLGIPEEGGRIPEDVPFVDGDNVSSSREAVEHLISLGHRHIACVTGETGLAATRQRLEGYLQAMQTSGLPIWDRWIVSGDSTKAGGRRAMEKLLALPGSGIDGDGPGPPTAVFAGNDLMAVGALRAARDAGWRVPEDISIVGFDGIPLAELVEPALTTVKQPIYEFGRRLADVLLAQLDGLTDEMDDARASAPRSQPVQRHFVPGRLVVRQSTAPPRGAPTPARVTDAQRGSGLLW